MKGENCIRCESADAVAWDHAVDAVVVGFGGAGAAAALEARERGCSVLAFDRFDGGGATAYSGGIYYAGNTRFQREAGYDDSVDEMYKYLALEVGDVVSPPTLRKFCEESEANIDWLSRHGVVFDSSAYEGKTIYPPEGKFLYYAGNEKIPAYARHAKPAPRGHRTKGVGFTGKDFFAALKRAAIAAGVDLRRHAKVTRLVVDKGGAVVGVEAQVLEQPADRERHQELYRKIDPMQPFIADKAEAAIMQATELENAKSRTMLVRARKGVVLSTGGFSYNRNMLEKYLPLVARNISCLMRLGSMGCDGSGIQLGMSVGGSVGKMTNVFLGRAIAPPDELVRGLMVNTAGQRFVNEDAYTGLLGNAILEQPEGRAWLIIDNATYYRTLRQCFPNGDGNFKPYKFPAVLNFLFGGTKKARSIAELAGKCGIPPASLEQTVREHNEACATGRPDPAGKHADYVRPLGKGPYRAVNSSIGNKFSFPIFFTLGGLRVDEERGLVMTDNGAAIPGLYAAGRAAVGICSNSYLSGMSLADCVFSGRRAARDLAAANPD